MPRTTHVAVLHVSARPDGSKVVGESQKGKYHGQVTYTWADGAVYVGEMREVCQPACSSTLTLRFDSVQLIVTCIAQGKRHGHGRYTYAKGGYYEGEWQNGKHNGQGKHVDAKGRVYEGSWKDGQKHGEYKPSRWQSLLPGRM